MEQNCRTCGRPFTLSGHFIHVEEYPPVDASGREASEAADFHVCSWGCLAVEAKKYGAKIPVPK
jgi:hypothetical protein